MFLPKEHHQQNDEDDEGQRVKNVHGAHHYDVSLAAGEARDGAVKHADGQGDKSGAEGRP